MRIFPCAFVPFIMSRSCLLPAHLHAMFDASEVHFKGGGRSFRAVLLHAVFLWPDASLCAVVGPDDVVFVFARRFPLAFIRCLVYAGRL